EAPVAARAHRRGTGARADPTSPTALAGRPVFDVESQVDQRRLANHGFDLQARPDDRTWILEEARALDATQGVAHFQHVEALAWHDPEAPPDDGIAGVGVAANDHIAQHLWGTFTDLHDDVHFRAFSEDLDRIKHLAALPR